MNRFAFIIFTALFFLIAYVSKPTDKKCIIEGVAAVWGSYVPSTDFSRQYEAFMDATSKAVLINDWVFLKQIKYQYKSGYKTIGFGAFNTVFTF